MGVGGEIDAFGFAVAIALAVAIAFAGFAAVLTLAVRVRVRDQVMLVDEEGLDVRIAGGGVGEQGVGEASRKGGDQRGGKLLGSGVEVGEGAEIAFEVGGDDGCLVRRTGLRCDSGVLVGGEVDGFGALALATARRSDGS